MSGNTKSLPTFFIVGAHKSATTSVHDSLAQIEGIFMSPVKEPRFFALKDDNLDYRGPNDPASKCDYQSIDAYQALFEKAKAGDQIGESSTLYLYDERAPENILKYVPDARIIAILRDPIKRAHSNFNYSVMLGREDQVSFRQALDKEEERISLGWGPFWHYKRKGLYGDQLDRYYKLFGHERIKVIKYEDLQSSFENQIKEILSFLDIQFDLDITVQRPESNKTSVPKGFVSRFFVSNKTLIRKVIPTSLRKSLNIQKLYSSKLFGKPDPISENDVEYLKDYYLSDRVKLESNTKLKFNDWL
ncbi:MAG: sulfotransferase [Ekhidna sp.]|nr:sulfotransferase [Ekhidna sp.]